MNRLLCFLCLYLIPSFLYGQYQRASDSEDNVKNKLFPKVGKFEISMPTGGLILNQSYVDSYLIQGGLTYYLTETWGLGLEGIYVLNSDRPERFCIEHFYNDPFNQLTVPCPIPTDDINAPLKDSKGNAVRGASFGPAYAPIRELNILALATAVWNPIYGKQLAFLSFTSYFDLFVTMGLGAALSTFYPESLYLRNGKKARGDLPLDFPPSGCPKTIGACPNDADVDTLIGANGRPDSLSETSPMITLGLGQKFHFAKRFHLKAELRNFTLLGGPNTYETYFAMWFGVGVRF